MSNGVSMDRVDEIIDGYGCKMHHLIAIKIGRAHV